MNAYPISEKLDRALQKLYPGEETGQLALGLIGVDPSLRKQPADPRTPYGERIEELVKIIEYWVDLNARQLDEFEGEYDETRLKFEARAMLLVLRELHRLFPEVVV
jgi:hypothetical protein